MNQRFIPILLVTIGIFVLLDSYLWTSYQKTISPKYFRFLKWLIPLTSLLFFLGFYLIYWRASNGMFNATKYSNFIIGFGFGMLIVKLVMASVFAVEDITRIFLFIKEKITSEDSKNVDFQSRRRFVRNLSFALASLPFIGTIYAITRGKYNYQIKKLRLNSNRLPQSFDGLRVVQFSDFHAGSFDNIEKVRNGFQLIQELKPDVLLFTGDLVNNRTSEAVPFLELFSELSAKYGKFAILGNHDYGDYVPFKYPEERAENRQQIEDFFEKSGFALLNNAATQIKNEKNVIDIIGVENWGSGRFPKYGDLEKASAGLSENDFKIVLSHDPDHWEYIIRKHEKTFDFTFSGHTHGFQSGIKIPGWKWSPAKYRYKRWLGHYVENNRHLYVSKGFGFLGFPGRIGMLPEIVCVDFHSQAEV